VEDNHEVFALLLTRDIIPRGTDAHCVSKRLLMQRRPSAIALEVNITAVVIGNEKHSPMKRYIC
jgi:hypothetical protein